VTRIEGIICPILTPFDGGEELNLVALKAEVLRMAGAGVHGVFAFGTNGEGYALEENEKEAGLSAVVEAAAGKLPVYAGTGCATTRATIRQSLRAKAIGADALSIVAPYFAKASQEELYQHYLAVAKAADMPVILYNIPARTGNALSPATVGRLSQISAIRGAKDSSGDFDNILQYLEATKGRDFAILAGNDSLILWTLMAGGTGAVSGCANVFPKNMAAIYEKFKAGDIAGARACQDAIRPLRDCFKYGNPNTIIKAAAELLGHPVGKCRAPFNQVPPEGIAALRKVLEDAKANGVE
jgi:4-hydroxy-tetrahydrodipicolinate synthase